MHRKMKFQGLQMVWVWTFRSLVHQNNSLWEVVKLKKMFQKNEVVTGKTPFFVLTILFVLTLSSDMSIMYENSHFKEYRYLVIQVIHHISVFLSCWKTEKSIDSSKIRYYWFSKQCSIWEIDMFLWNIFFQTFSVLEIWNWFSVKWKRFSNEKEFSYITDTSELSLETNIMVSTKNGVLPVTTSFFETFFPA